MKGQPLAYNKDNQEDKEPLFDTVDTLADTLAIMTDLVAAGIAVDAERMRAAAREGYATATDLADYLVQARACRFATRTKRSRARCAMPRRGATCDCRLLARTLSRRRSRLSCKSRQRRAAAMPRARRC